MRSTSQSSVYNDWAMANVDRRCTTTNTVQIKRYVAGIDEVGRGPLAGPVSVGLVMWLDTTHDPHTLLSGIRDSKQLSSSKRVWWVEKLQQLVKEQILWTTVVSTKPEVIDEKGIMVALAQAAEKALAQGKKQIGFSEQNVSLLSDYGLPTPQSYTTQHIIKGDEKEPLIAAASIVAKVWRDARMEHYHTIYPHYALNTNKGYGTAFHRKALRDHGPTVIHRRSFLKNIELFK